MRIRKIYDGRAYTAGRDAQNRFAGSLDRISVYVTPRGHWYRSDDPRDGFHNDTVCRGCAHHGHFPYILDYRPCTAPASESDIAEALSQRPMTEMPVAARTTELYAGVAA